MNILKKSLQLGALMSVLLLTSNTLFSQLLPPNAENITVCEGGSTVIIPEDPNDVTDDGFAGTVILATQDFDGGGLAYTPSIMFNDGVNDHFNITDGTDISQISGQYGFQDGTNMFWAAEDVNDAGGDGVSPQNIVFDAVTITDFNEIEFCFDLAAGNQNPLGSNGYDAADFVNVNYSFDGGTTFMPSLCFNYFDNGDAFNEPLGYDTDCDGDGTEGGQVSIEGTTYCFTVPDAESMGQSSIVWEIQVAMDGGNEEIAFDNIEFRGTPMAAGENDFNYYDVEPIIGTTIPIATGTTYDPMTTVATSPDTIWVTVFNDQLESEATQVIVIVNANATAEAGFNEGVCGAVDVTLSADPIALDATGAWSGGVGSFSDVTDNAAIYTPDASEIGTTVDLLWTVTTPSCGSAEDAVTLYFAAETESAEFSYAIDTICPGDGSLLPMHTIGIDGRYELISGNPDSLSLDSITGEVDIAASGMGTFVIQNTVSACGNLIITGVIDGPLAGGIPKAIELYALNTVSDLSVYSFGSANNGGGSDGEEFPLPAGNVAAGTYLYIASENTGFTDFFGFAPDYITAAALINGDDALELFCNGEVIDVFGEIDVDGTGQPWDHIDGWAYRNNDTELNYASFNDTNWSFSGTNALDGETDNASAATPFPIGTYSSTFTGVCENEVFTETLIIGDFEAPVVVCPGDITISLDAGDCGGTPSLPDPMAMDNCTDDLTFVYISGPINGDFLDKENSPYTVVYEATEDNGNVITCSYTITVEEFANTTSTLACNGSINVSLDENCEALIGADALLEGGSYGCYEDFGVVATLDGTSVGTQVDNEFGAGYSVVLDNSILNQPIEISIIELGTGNSCWGTVTVEDKLAPVIMCMDTTLNCGEDYSSLTPSVIENCGSVFFELEEDVELGSCLDTFSSQITRIWIAIDDEGNESEPCTQIITVRKDDFADLELPLNYDGLEGNFDPLACDGAGITFAVGADGLPSPTAIGILPGTGVPSLGAGCSELIVYYEDIVLPLCGTTYKVIREWTIVEWCTGIVVEHTQIIKVADQVGPSFIAPSDQTIAATSHCHGEYQLPLVPASDNCGTALVTFTSDEGIIANGTFFVDVPVLGQAYTINAVGTDECGNETIEPFTITFQDLTAPVVVAETSLTISLAADGIAKLYASSIDDGSYDGCTGVGMSVIRMVNSCAPQDYFPPAGDDNFQFNEVVHFCCDDTAEPQMVVFRVCDDASGDGVFGNIADNCNTAMVEVIVQTKQAPVIICPPFMFANCVDVNGIDYSDSDLLDELFGTPVVENICGGNLIANAIYQEECGAGIVLRTFIASNDAGVSVCTQAIAVNQNLENQLSCDRIKFEGLNNNIYSWCAINDNDNDFDDDLPAIEIDCNDGFSIPALDLNIDGLCTEVGESVSVDTFNFSGGACKKYLLHYEVIDQCVFEENYVDPITGELDPFNSDNGYYEFYLEIDAFDDEGPVFDPADLTITADNCEDASFSITEVASDVCTDAAFIGYQYRVDVFSDDSIDFPVGGGWANGNTIASNTGVGSLPVGVHTIYWISTDGCGNSTPASQTVTVEVNSKEPTPYCKTGFKVSISAMGMFTVNAEDFDAGSFDNCTSQNDLIFSFSPNINDTERMYTCDDLGFQFIQVYVTDSDGNQDFCNTTFLVQDNGSFCGSTVVSGLISSDNGYTNKEAEVMLSDIESQMQMVLSDDNGIYNMPIDVVSDQATLSATDNNNILHGVTTFDIITIQKHILGIAPLTTNAQLIAADVNNNGSVTGADIIQIRKVILGHQDFFANNDSWIVYPANFDIESSVNAYDYPREILLAGAETYDWKSIKVADVNMSHSELGGQAVETRSSRVWEYEINTIGAETIVSFYGQSSDVAGLELNLVSLRDAVNLEVVPANFSISKSDYSTSKGLRLSYIALEDQTDSDDLLFSIVLGDDVDVNSLQADFATSELYIGKGALTEARSISLRERKTDELELSDVTLYPNPFSAELSIDLTKINAPQELTIFNLEGKAIYTTNEIQEITILDASLFVTSGVYYIQIKTEDQIIHKKVLKID